MPVQKGTSKLLQKLGARAQQAYAAHANDETEYSNFGELPEGIENGIAQLVDIKIDEVKAGKENAGQLYFYAAGVVKLPAEVGGIPVKGLRTSIIEPLYDTPTRSRKAFDEHYAWVMNELAKLGVDRAQMGPDSIEGVLAALREAKPHFRFRTWKGQATEQYPDPRVNHQWNGYLEYTEEVGNGEVVDNSGATAAPPAPRAALPSKPNPARTTPAQPTSKASPVTTPPRDDYQLMELVQGANAGNQEAIDNLHQQAVDSGYSEQEVDSAPNWEAVADMVRSPKAAVPAENGWAPAVEEIYAYKPIDPKTKKPYVDSKTKEEKKAVECEVMAVDKATRTMTLKRLDTKAEIKGVPWDALEKE